VASSIGDPGLQEAVRLRSAVLELRDGASPDSIRKRIKSVRALADRSDEVRAAIRVVERELA
jgi:hypothetical protein